MTSSVMAIIIRLQASNIAVAGPCRRGSDVEQ
jgi:hypothetical protein